MEFEWDEAKRLSNIEKHGLDFRRLQQLFDGRPVFTAQSGYLDELRWVTTGNVEDRLITVVWTERGNAIRFISARRARNAEERTYRALHG